MVVRHVAQPSEGFEHQANALEVEIGRIDAFKPGEVVHLVARRERKASVSQRAKHFAQQWVVRASDAGPPVSLARASRQLAGQIEESPTVHGRDRPTTA